MRLNLVWNPPVASPFIPPFSFLLLNVHFWTPLNTLWYWARRNVSFPKASYQTISLTNMRQKNLSIEGCCWLMISEAFSKPTYSINQEKFCENRSNKKQINEKSNWIQIQSEEQSVYGLLGKVQGEKPCWRHGVMDRVRPALTPPHPRTYIPYPYWHTHTILWQAWRARKILNKVCNKNGGERKNSVLG